MATGVEVRTRVPGGGSGECRPQPAALVRVRGRDRRQHHGSHGRDDRQRRRPVHPGRARWQRLHPAVAARRLHARVRRVPDYGRPTGRYVRPPPPVPDRLGRLHGDVRRLRHCPIAGRADRLPRVAGFVRGADDPPRIRDAQRGLRRRRDDQGLRRLWSDDGSFDPGGAHSGRRAGGGQSVGDRMATGVPHQRADRHRRVRRRSQSAAQDGRASGYPSRHRGDGADRCRVDRDHLPADPGPRRRVASLDLRFARRWSDTARRIRTVGASPSRRSVDRARLAHQPQLHERHPRRARLLRSVRRPPAMRLAVRAARRALLTGPCRA